jgi:CDP-glucose 4,6-dehydratase
VEGLVNAAALRATYAGVRVLVTGHTGFKGGWLARWLHRLGAEVHGLALSPDGPARLHTLLPDELRARERIVDVRDEAAVRAAIEAIEPALVLHLAAQALVRRSYREPALTFATNVQGTVHVLEACRSVEAFRAAVVVTTDKVYADDGGAWGYRESDRLGGHDPYAASKAACELAVASLRQSFPARLGRGA